MSPRLPPELRARIEQYLRNGRWGTCSGCPRDLDGRAYPEFCEFTQRSDHQLDWDSLDEQVRRELKNRRRGT